MGGGSRLVDGMVGVQYTGRPRAGIYWQWASGVDWQPE
jgi:hypothetical protein